jgi:hypothetical protein
LELLRALDRPKGNTCGAEEKLDERLKKVAKAGGTRGQLASTGGSNKEPQEDMKRRARSKHPGGISKKERVEEISGGYVVRDASGQALVYVYRRTNESEGSQAKALTEDEARHIAINVGLLRRND